MNSFKRLKQLSVIIIIAVFIMPFTVNFARATTEITVPTVDYQSYSIDGTPKGFNTVYYDGIFTRGFSWITDATATDTELFVVESNAGKNADFTSADVIDGTEISDTVNGLAVIYHKAHVENLLPGKTYSYKAGSDKGYVYGKFTVDNESCSDGKITIVNVNDAQTKNPDLLCKWENTVNVATKTVSDIDFYAFGGDQFDHNMLANGNTTSQSTMSRVQRYAIARDTVQNIVGSTPYIATSGNHEALTDNIFVNTSDVNFTNGLTSPKGATYSFDYDFMHFVVIDTNITGTGTPVATLKSWLQQDLSNAKSNENIKWTVCLMHNGLYATGDHSNNSTTKSLITNLAPVFSENHIDFVMQAHDHTFNKTLAYRWDAQGYTTTYNNNEIVNINADKYTFNGNNTVYDLNPDGTYYVTCGAAGHRVGEEDGNWAIPSDDVNTNSYYKNTYKIENGSINVNSVLASKGDIATANPNKQMFGKLEITEQTLSYSFYYVDGGEAVLYDTLSVLKDEDIGKAKAFTENVSTATKEDIDAFLGDYIESQSLRSIMTEEQKTALRNAVSKYTAEYETERRTKIAGINAIAGDKEIKLALVQCSEETNGAFNVRVIASTSKNPEEVKDYYFDITCTVSGVQTGGKKVYAREVYSVGITADNQLGIKYAHSVVELSGTGHIFGINIKNVPSDKVIVFTVTPKMISVTDTVIVGTSYDVTFAYGYYVSCIAHV